MFEYTTLFYDLHILFTWNVYLVVHDYARVIWIFVVSMKKSPRHDRLLVHANAFGRAFRVRDPFRDAFVSVEMVNGPLINWFGVVL